MCFLCHSASLARGGMSNIMENLLTVLIAELHTQKFYSFALWWALLAAVASNNRLLAAFFLLSPFPPPLISSSSSSSLLPTQRYAQRTILWWMELNPGWFLASLVSYPPYNLSGFVLPFWQTSKRFCKVSPNHIVHPAFADSLTSSLLLIIADFFLNSEHAF